MEGGLQVPWRRRLDGKVVLVTGASSGIGRELCIDLARAGCLIVAAARRADRLRSLCEEIHGGGSAAAAVRAMAVDLDVTAGSAEVAAAVEKAWGAFGWIDVLINNAGMRGAVRPPLDWPEEEWNQLIDTNLVGSWNVTKHVCLRMRDANRKGSIINIGSIGGLVRGHYPGGFPYGVSKTALNAITRILAMELGEHGIRVNSINPGLFKSEMTEGLMQKKWLKDVMGRIVPLKDLGSLDPALTSLVRYLIDDSSGYVTGNEFIVDSGTTIPGLPIFSSL